MVKPISGFHKGGDSYKDGYRGQCKTCRCAYTTKYKMLHLQEVNACKLKWKRANKDKLNFKERIRYHADIDKSRKSNRLKQTRRKDKKADYTRKRRLLNLEKERERCRKWDAEHPGKLSDRAKRRRARKMNAIIENFPSVEIYERDQWICQLCYKMVDKFLKFPDPFSASIDHTIPLAQNGTHERKNVQLAHLICNQ